MVARDEKVDAWMPMFPRDFLSGTEGLSAVDGWAYTRLLLHSWLEHGYLPFDAAELARLAKVTPLEWVATWSRLGRFFDVADGRISQRRLLYELEQARTNRKKRRAAGQAGAEGRWAGGKRTQSTRRKMRSHGSPDPASPSESEPLTQGTMRSQCPSPPPSPSPPSSPPPGSGGDARAARPPGPPVIVSSSPTPRSPSQATRKASSSDPSKARLANGPSLDAPSSTSADASPLDRALGAFAAAWEQRYREAYWPTDADRSQLGRVLRSLPDELARALPVCFSRYLADTDRFIAEKKRHSLTWFIREEGWNKYRVTVPALSAKQARTAAALAKFVNGGGDGRAG